MSSPIKETTRRRLSPIKISSQPLSTDLSLPLTIDHVSPIKISGSPLRRQRISEMEQEFAKRRKLTPQTSPIKKTTKSVSFDIEEASSAGGIEMRLSNIEKSIQSIHEKLVTIQTMQEKIYDKLDKDNITLRHDVERVQQLIDDSVQTIYK
ncbi:uncharacterized protein J8A68_005811 [[Candida] subhashii]|uniref:Uncharacterized protein n=1 Tax=[Candida] subhashii TaxID=561895 RepID=A0A8J5UUS4_9ASCO|nr:uncharacterized protein J8A68_005811 [[Candida] subhashii]KAG7660694.1 hypothetical protein J8A68_005811 [[Candida] subhashii]